MTLAGFLQFVELQTKVASVTPFALGTLYALYRYRTFNLPNFLIMFVSLLTFDMATTAINNYIDYKKARHTDGYNYQSKNAMVTFGISERTAVSTIFTLLAVAVVFGILLTLQAGPIVLLIGMISFAAGILYTFGPIPISRMPLGELFSGFFMGFIILFLSIFIHVDGGTIASLTYQAPFISLQVNFMEVFYIFLISIPTIAGIANIMLANNICDVDEDIVNGRFTLPYHIGKENAHRVFRALYYIGYVDIIALVALGVAPFWSLLVLLTLRPVYKNIGEFHDRPFKGETFVLSVKNFALVNWAHIMVMGLVVLTGVLR